MPKFMAIGYGDRAGYESTASGVRNAAHSHDVQLRNAGAQMWVAENPVQVRNHNDTDLVTSAGPFMNSSLPVAGFSIVEAADIDEAARMVSGTPCAVSQGVVEVWPLTETPF